VSETPACSGIILAGGQSRRMGRDKAWIELDGVPLVVRVLARIRGLTDDVVIVTNDPAPFERLGTRLVGDEIPGAGPLAGIAAGLEAVRHAYAVVVACDMPFLNVALLRYLLSLAPGYDLVIPNLPTGQEAGRKREGGGRRAKDLDLHPLHAVYSKQCLAPLRAALERGDRQLTSFHDAVRVRIVPPDEILRFDPQGRSVQNLNTPQDLESAANQLDT
jgi:molybdopterin-guanine dinucleotide biosynthesis protein A